MSRLTGLRSWAIVAAAFAVFQPAIAQDAATGRVSAINVPPSQYWDGIDGRWSTFGIQLGTPPQAIRVLPMTQSGAIYTVLPEGCIADDPVNCGELRGRLFLTDRTTTWNALGLYSLSLFHETPLGYEGNALYGHDAMTLGWPGDNLPGLNSSIIAGIATKDFYTGGLPLNPWSVNFTSLTDSTPSMMTLLKNESKIPSLSYGYTAGYYNNNPSVAGSLTLGGYDRSRFVDSNISFVMGPDISRDLMVGIQSITTGSTTLLSQPIFAFLDSAIPTIWLPLDVCQAFETAFNLTWNATEELYTVSDTLHTQLLAQNPSVTFTIGPQATGESLTIEMPYGAFDLESQVPFTSEPGRYFPLKRANDSTQYTLGRAFFQSAYVIANYEYYNFSVHQATYPTSSVSLDLVSLPAFGASLDSDTSTTLSSGAIAGIAVGAAAVVILALGLLFYFCIYKKRKQRKELHELENTQKAEEREKQTQTELAQLDDAVVAVHEAEGTNIGHEMDAQNTHKYRYEPPVELPVNEVAAWEAHSEASTPFVTPSTTPAPNPSISPLGYPSPLSPVGYQRKQNPPHY